MKVAQHGCEYNDGRLTPWHKEALLQRKFYDWPANDYDIEVQAFSSCVGKEVVHHKISRHHCSGGISKVQWNHPLFVPSWGGVDAFRLQCPAGDIVSVQEQLDLWGLGDVAASIPMLLAPWPLAFLVARRRWKRLLLLLRWNRALRLHRARRCVGPLPGMVVTCVLSN